MLEQLETAGGDEFPVVLSDPFSLMAAILVGFLANAALFQDHHELSISRIDGAILLFFFLLFLLYVYKMARETVLADTARAPLGRARSATYIALGVAGLYFGGRWTVDGAVELARMAETAGRDPAEIEIGVFSAPRDDAKLAELARAGVSRAIFTLPSVEKAVVIEKLDQYAEFLDRV